MRMDGHNNFCWCETWRWYISGRVGSWFYGPLSRQWITSSPQTCHWSIPLCSPTPGCSNAKQLSWTPPSLLCPGANGWLSGWCKLWVWSLQSHLVAMCSASLHGTQPADNSSQHLGTFLDHHSWSRPVARHTSSNPICQDSWCLKLRRTTQCAFVCSCMFLLFPNFTQVRRLQVMILLNSCSLFTGTFFATLLPWNVQIGQIGSAPSTCDPIYPPCACSFTFQAVSWTHLHLRVLEHATSCDKVPSLKDFLWQRLSSVQAHVGQQESYCRWDPWPNLI